MIGLQGRIAPLQSSYGRTFSHPESSPRPTSGQLPPPTEIATVVKGDLSPDSSFVCSRTSHECNHIANALFMPGLVKAQVIVKLIQVMYVSVIHLYCSRAFTVRTDHGSLSRFLANGPLGSFQAGAT